jgi:GYF domain 2
MGIKFHCPNGHKLNVKAFLAGKKGVCPKCGTKFRIPAESEPGLVDSDLEEGDAGASAVKSGNGTPATAQPQPELAAAASSPKAAPLAAPATGVHADPIAEGPQLVWYVRPPTGGQFGPARGDIMRTWLSEGRITRDSLVWREGWTAWQTAGNIFPSLNSAAAPQPAALTPLASLATVATPQLSTRTADKKKTSGMAVAILVGLGLLCLVLVAVLAFVLTTVQ